MLNSKPSVDVYKEVLSRVSFRAQYVMLKTAWSHKLKTNLKSTQKKSHDNDM